MADLENPLFVAAVRLLLLCTSIAATARAQQPAPRSPLETVKALHLPAGFTATLFAGEPDLVQPIGFSFDDRGRLWVAENTSYPNWTPDHGHDRILIFEDTDGDGHFDKRTVFYEGLNYLTGLEVGFGGVYAVSAPSLLFIPDRDHDDKPDGPPQVLLDGFGHQGVHNLVNGCAWGPDGWLYGGHGGTSSGLIGAPGTPDKDRTFFDGGVWRYHPTKKIFEAVMEGTTNPWGLDFDDFGQGFIPNSVTPHLYHVIFGAHVERRKESPNSRYAYEVIDTIADHRHWTGAKWEDSRGGKPEQVILGGGHAHCGLMVYLGDNWPDAYRGGIFINNIHGDRMNEDLPQRKGSGYVAHHGADFVTSSDPWYMALHVKYGPDGAVYVSDWYDTGECHTRKPHTENGRIYKIAWGTPKPLAPFDVSKMSDAELVKLQLHKNDWWVRHARRVLQERGADEASKAALLAMLKDNPDVPRRLRALWCLHVTGDDPTALLSALLADRQEWLRAWAVQLLVEDRHPSAAVLAEFERLAASDPSPLVRLFLASAMTRLAPAMRWGTLQNLVVHGEDAADPNLPLMEWYALEPLVPLDPKRALDLAIHSRIPKLRQFVARRIAESDLNHEGTKDTKN
ncbi:MAG TPA: PVC-type heme-binding CxxCH protein [Tepidisphaeraceae bacterium]